MEKLIFSVFDRPPKTLEVHDQPGVVDLGSYQDPKEQIMQQIRSGEILELSRRGYEFAPGETVPEGYYDHTSHKSYDYAAAKRDLINLRERLQARKAAKAAAKQAEETEQGGSGPEGFGEESGVVQ